MSRVAVRSINYPCSVMTAPPGWSRTRRNSLDLTDHELWLIWGGRGWMSDGKTRRPLRSGSCVWMRPGGIYDAGQDESQPLRIAFVHFTPEPGSAVGPEYVDTSASRHVLAMMQAIVARVPRMPTTVWGEPAETTAATRGLLEALLDDLIDTRPTSPRGIDDAPIHEIAELLWQGEADDLSVHGLADSLGVTPSHFSRRFKSVVGVSPQQWAIEGRLQRARVLLRESSLSIGSIADSLGYADAFAFSKQFKRFTGQSPSAYRRG